MRRTEAGTQAAHHLLDPVTGHPAETAANLVTVIAARCADAEWLATAIAAEGSLGAVSATAGGATVMLVDGEGGYSTIGSPEVFLR